MKDLIKIEKRGIFARLKDFFKNIFSNNKTQVNYMNNMSNISFKEDYKIKENKELIRLLDLQTRFKNGEINEEDIDYDDYDKLLKLYDEQNEKLTKEINNYKKDIEYMINKIKR